MKIFATAATLIALAAPALAAFDQLPNGFQIDERIGALPNGYEQDERIGALPNGFESHDR